MVAEMGPGEHLRMQLSETQSRLTGIAWGLDQFMAEHFAVCPEGEDFDSFAGQAEHLHVLIDSIRERVRLLEGLECRLGGYDLVPRRSGPEPDKVVARRQDGGA